MAGVTLAFSQCNICIASINFGSSAIVNLYTPKQFLFVIMTSEGVRSNIISYHDQ